MGLTTGTRLGTYNIISLIGAGGMGEVYRARDTELNRDVALKILPDSFADDRERVARFRREAQVLAALNHPHVMAIYGLGEANGSLFLVLEFVDGQTLAERLRTGALALTETLTVARQIAEALQAAHEKGIIHRDLKPANIALTARDQVKVLDFGLAKALESGRGASDDTTMFGVTRESAILGTAAYMSPEQAKGRQIDKRSDVWAFGCVLYEMLTGRRAFAGDGVSDTLAAVLRGEPDWTALPADLPPHIRTLIKRCLEKDRQQRIPDIATALFLINEPSAAPDVSVAVAPRGRSADPPALDVSDLRGRLILAHSDAELVRLKYEVEQHLATQPHDVEGRILKDDVARALAARIMPANAAPASTPSAAPLRSRRFLYAMASAPVVLLLAVGMYALVGRSVTAPSDVAENVVQPAPAPVVEPSPAATPSPVVSTQPDVPAPAPPVTEPVRPVEPATVAARPPQLPSPAAAPVAVPQPARGRGRPARGANAVTRIPAAPAQPATAPLSASPRPSAPVPVSGAARNTLENRYRQDVVGECTAIVATRYPFVVGSTTDVPLADFGRLFGYGGVYDMFFRSDLASLVDTSRSPWAWRNDASGVAVGGSIEMLRQFEAADRIRGMFFRPGSQVPEVRFSALVSDLDAGATRVTLDIDGQTIGYSHGPVIAKAMMWPGANPGKASVTFEERGPARPNIAAEGPWAWFRLMESGQGQPETEAVYLVTFQKGGHQTRMRIESVSIRNPFGKQALHQFRCG